MPLDVDGVKRRAAEEEARRTALQEAAHLRAVAHADTIRRPLRELGRELVEALQKEQVPTSEALGWKLWVATFSFIGVDGYFGTDTLRGHTGWEKQLYTWSFGPAIVLKDGRLHWRNHVPAIPFEPGDRDMYYYEPLDSILSSHVLWLKERAVKEHNNPPASTLNGRSPASARRSSIWRRLLG